MKYSVEKYNIVIHQHPEYHGVEIIAWSTYAGKPVYGKAICRAGDTYNEETGKRLAIARCAAKIAKKRLKRANKLCNEANAQVKAAMDHGYKMDHYYRDAREEYLSACEEVENILNELA